MMPHQERFYEIGAQFSDARRRKVFGHEAFTVQRKPFIFLEGEHLVCKLNGRYDEEVFLLPGVRFFAPMGPDKPMKNWVALPYAHEAAWEEWALRAYEQLMRELA